LFTGAFLLIAQKTYWSLNQGEAYPHASLFYLQNLPVSYEEYNNSCILSFQKFLH
jgi:hypothetical protein